MANAMDDDMHTQASSGHDGSTDGSSTASEDCEGLRLVRDDDVAPTPATPAGSRSERGAWIRAFPPSMHYPVARALDPWVLVYAGAADGNGAYPTRWFQPLLVCRRSRVSQLEAQARAALRALQGACGSGDADQAAAASPPHHRLLHTRPLAEALCDGGLPWVSPLTQPGRTAYVVLEMDCNGVHVRGESVFRQRDGVGSPGTVYWTEADAVRARHACQMAWLHLDRPSRLPPSIVRACTAINGARWQAVRAPWNDAHFDTAYVLASQEDRDAVHAAWHHAYGSLPKDHACYLQLAVCAVTLVK